MAWIFLAVVALQAAMRLWLSRRQERHVLAHRDAVPAAFRGSISLEQIDEWDLSGDDAVLMFPAGLSLGR